MGEPRKHGAEWKQPDACYMNLVIDDMFNIGKSVEQKADQWLLGIRGWGWWWSVAGGEVLGFFLAWWKYFEIKKVMLVVWLYEYAKNTLFWGGFICGEFYLNKTGFFKVPIVVNAIVKSTSLAHILFHILFRDMKKKIF